VKRRKRSFTRVGGKCTRLLLIVVTATLPCLLASRAPAQGEIFSDDAHSGATTRPKPAAGPPAVTGVVPEPAAAKPNVTSKPATPVARRLVPGPDAASRQHAFKLVQDVYGPEIAKAKQPAERVKLAEKLLQAGIEEQREEAGRYVLLTLAIDIATSVGDFGVGFRAIDELGSSYQIDVLKLKADAAVNLNRSLRSPQDHKDFVATLDSLVDQGINRDRYDIARQLAEAALAAARATDITLARQVAPRVQQVREAQAGYEDAGPAMQVLARTPADRDANLKVGKFRCFLKRDWEQGLPLLAQGSDEILKRAALQDLAGASEPDKQVSLGDTWWDQAEKLTGSAKAASQLRAAHWYQLAAVSLDKGLLHEKLEHRISLAGAPQGGSLAGSQTVRAPATLGHAEWSIDNLPQYQQLNVARTWESVQPRSTLAAQTIDGTLTLTQENSPYLVTGDVVVTAAARLTIEPGAVVLFAPQVKLQVDGALTAVSDGAWMVLAAAGQNGRWTGLLVQGKADLRRCLIGGADVAVSAPRANVSAVDCIIAESGIGIDVGNLGHGTATGCLFLRNETGVYPHGNTGNMQFSKCLFLLNKRACSANFYGTSDGKNSTFYGNQTAIEASDRGEAVRVTQSNIFTTTPGSALGSRGGKVVAVGNYWGKAAPSSDAHKDCSNPLPAPVRDAMPSFSGCQYLTLSAAATIRSIKQR
jgi:hypothetical protein